MVAIARRRQLLNDHVLLALAESSWALLDISGSDVSDFGLSKVAEMCTNLQAVDIRYEEGNVVSSHHHFTCREFCQLEFSSCFLFNHLQKLYLQFEFLRTFLVLYIDYIT